MLIKRYASPCLKFTENVKVDGKQFPIVFDRFNNDTKRRYVEISDPAIQAQFEKSASFNVYFFLESEVTITETEKVEVNHVEVPAPKLPANVKRFKNAKDCKEWLNKEQGIAYREILTTDNMIKKGAEKGFIIEFENKK